MSSRKAPRKPLFATPRERIRAIALLAATLPLAWLAFANAVVGVARAGNPEMALRFNPTDPAALANAAGLALARPGGGGEARAEALARRSLEGQALNPHALSVLGFVEEARGNRDRARAYMRMAERLSRRDTGAQFWLIEDRIRQGDVAGAVAHYDVVMRASLPNRTLLFPILAEAMASPEIRRALVPYVRGNAPWLLHFMSSAVQAGPNPQFIAATILQSGGLPRGASAAEIEGRLLARLAQEGYFADLARFARSLPGVDRAVLTSADLSAATVEVPYAAIGWQRTQDAAISTTVIAPAAGPERSIGVFVAAGGQGLVARKLLLLAPGRYMLSSRAAPIRGDRGAGLRFELQCRKAAGSETIWRSAILAPVDAVRRMEVTIPAGCDAFSLDLIAASGAAAQDAEFVVKSIELRRIG